MLIALVACTPRGQITLDPTAAQVGHIETVFVGTTRKREADLSFGGNRSETVQFAQFDISIPPTHQVGQIDWAKRGATATSQRNFVATSEEVFSNDSLFRTKLRQQIAAQGGDAVIFVHGYNTNFAEGVYRVAQFAYDLKIPGAVVEYSWPSAAQALGYAYDRDSALFARDGLEALLQEVAHAGARRITLVGHSMGCGLIMESLRSVALRRDRRTLGLLHGVVLISPDLDVDVFREEALSIGTLPQPFVIFGSGRDKALRLSAALSGKSARLGSLTDISRVSDLKVTFLNVTEFSKDTKGPGHFLVGESPALIALLSSIRDVQGAFEADSRSRVGLVSGLVMTVQNATEIVLSPLAAIANSTSR